MKWKIEAVEGLDLKSYFARLDVLTEGPLDGLRTLVETRRTLERLESLLVARARASRASWTEIGDALGVSRQAAHSRHRPFVNPIDGDSPRPRG